ncbi:rhombosortase [Marinobacteraceae bacterium S3BR75-40.1]
MAAGKTLSPSLHRWLLPLVLSLLAVLLQMSPWLDLLRYQRSAVEAGEWWRLLTAHGVHLGYWHLLLNLLGLWLVWELVGEALSNVRWLLTLAIVALGTSVGLYLGHPQLQWYVGLSGVLHGLLVAGALGMLSRQPVLALALLGIVTVKVGLEMLGIADSGVAELIGGRVIYAAHLYGAVSGAVVGVAWMSLERLALRA